MERLSDAVAKSEESEALKKALRAERLRFAHLMADTRDIVCNARRPCVLCDMRRCGNCRGYSNWHWLWQEDTQPERKGGDYRSFLMQRFERGD